VNYEDVVFPEPEHFDHLQQEPDVISTGVSQETPNLQYWPPANGVAPKNKPQTTDECTLEYFRHYRYRIAPWVSWWISQ
jgi:hypothetical protein